MEEKPKLWTTTFVTITAVNFITALTYYLLAVKIVEYTLDTYAVSYSVAGATVTIYVIAAIFSRLAFGSKIDVWGSRKSAFIGLGLIAIASCLYVFELGLVMLFIIRAIHGMGFGIATGTLATAAGLIIPAERKGEGIGYFTMSQALATGIGPMVAILMANMGSSYFLLFLFAAIGSVVSLVAAMMLKLPNAQGTDTAGAGREANGGAGAEGCETNASKARGRFSIRSLIQVDVLPLLSVVFFVMFSYSGVLSYLTVFAEERSLTEAASLYFVVYAVIILLTRPASGKRVDRKGENSVMYICLASIMCGFVALALSFNGFVLLLSAALIGYGVGNAQSVIQTTVMRLAPPSEFGRANSTFFIAMDSGVGVGPVVIGALLPFVGYQTSFLLLAVMSGCVVLLYHMVHGRNAKR